MPYKITKDGEQWCVEKEGGKRMGCHDSEAKAKKQMAALYASEGKSIADMKLEMHRKFNELLNELDALEATEVYSTDDFNTPSEEGGPSFTQVENPNIPDEPAHDHPEPDTKTIYAAPDSNDTNLLKTITGKFKRGLKPGQTMIKTADGQRLMLIVTSNSYEDREAETLTSDALKSDVDRHWTQGDDAYMPNNKLLFWHDDALELGEIVWGDLVGPFYVELAEEAANPIAKAYWDYREQHPDEKWGASHRFGYYAHDRNGAGEYVRIFKQETSTLPLDAAANLITLSEVIPMSDKRAKKLDEILGFAGAYDLLKAEGFDALVGKLSAQGVDHKEKDDTPDQTADGQQALESIAKAFIAVTEDVAGLAAEVDDLKAQQIEAQKSYDDKNAELDDTLKAVKGLAEKLQERLDARPRSASRAAETEIESGDLDQDVQDTLLVNDPVFGKVLPNS